LLKVNLDVHYIHALANRIRVFLESSKMKIELLETFQTQLRGTNDQEYQIYLACADDGKGGDITNNGQPLKTYEEWLNA
jgi:hypothetical protein